jgi:hypothetical protein
MNNSKKVSTLKKSSVKKVSSVKKSSVKKVSSVKKSSVKKSSVILQPHQIEPTVIMTTNPKQHGLLLYYNMGTGKTIAALALILNYPEYVVNIICPNDIQFIWENEIKRIPAIRNKINFYSYEKISTFFNRNTFTNELIIMDEAHNIVNLLVENTNKISLINSCFKILILTGTPIYKDFNDLIYLVNLSAGKTLLSYNNTHFTDKYYDIIKSRSFVFGYFFPVGRNAISFTYNKMFNSVAYLMILGTIGQRLKLSDESNKLIVKLSSPLLATTKFSFSSVFKNAPSQEKLLEFINDGNIFNKEVGKAVISPFLIVSILYVLINFVYLITILLNMKYKLEDYKRLNTKRLVADIKQCVIIHKNKISNFQDNPFPSFEFITKEVSYSNFQLVEWLKLAQGRLDPKALRDLEITNFDNIEYYTKKLDLEIYTKNGIIIGNLSSEKDFSPKFNEILKISKGKKAVIYSSFTFNGILLFKDFLESKNINYLYLNSGISNEVKNEILNKFKNSSECFLLLHPSYTEGVSIFGAEQLHLLEPISLFAKKQQVVARVIRYHSHFGLPTNKRHVQVFQWACTINSVFSKFKKTLFSAKTWLQFNPEVFYTEKFSKFDQDISPDSIILKEELENSTKLNEIDYYLLKNNENKKEPECCITFPSSIQQENCFKPRCK